MEYYLKTEFEDDNGMQIAYRFNKSITEETVAVATNNVKEWITLFIDEDKYEFIGKPKKVEKTKSVLPYPNCNRWSRTLGFEILKNQEHYCEYYSDALSVEKIKKGPFSFNHNIRICVNSFEDNLPCVRYIVGFKGGVSRFYCIYRGNELIGIIERYHVMKSNGVKATIYLNEERNMTDVFLFAVSEIVWVGNSGNNDEYIDTSAGPYVSKYLQEQQFFNKQFLLSARENNT